jgi:hypothetical protein
MIASSVTGVSGPGDSNGKYKPSNNCSCSCSCGSSKEETTPVVKKNGCYKNYKYCKCSTVNKSGNVLKIKTC